MGTLYSQGKGRGASFKVLGEVDGSGPAVCRLHAYLNTARPVSLPLSAPVHPSPSE